MISTIRSLRSVIGLFLAERRRMLLLGSAFAAATVLAGMGLLGLSGWFITATSLAGLSTAAAITFDVFAPSAGIRLLAIVRTAARYGERLTTHDATLSVLAALRERLFRGWAEPAAATALMRRPAKLLFRLTADIDALDSLYLRVLVPVGVSILSGVVTAVALGLMSPLFGVLAGLWLVATGLGIPLVGGRLAVKPARRRAHAMEALRSRTIDLVAGQTELVMAGRLEAQRAAIAKADIRLAEADDQLNRIESAVSFGFGLVSTLLLTATLLTVATLAKAGVIGAPVATLGLLIAFAATEPFTALRRGALELGRTALAARRIGPRLARPKRAISVGLPPEGFAVCLDRVSARYEGSPRPALHDICLSFISGEHVALIGASGAGKSTLLALLAREIRAEHGRVELQPSTVLTQKTEIFQDTLRDNLRLADPKASDDALREILAAAGLLADIQALPMGLDAHLGEGGLGLSGGQLRRLVLARLLLRDTPLWLLDEPTEGLDGGTARDVMQRLLARSQGRTLVVATHIRREAAIADRIVVLDQGRAVETAKRGETEFDTLLARLRPD
jgi:ATP-binding cassette subfamily C protein CydC